LKNFKNTDILKAIDFEWQEPADQQAAFLINIQKAK
jgi:hypothetical protein